MATKKPPVKAGGEWVTTRYILGIEPVAVRDDNKGERRQDDEGKDLHGTDGVTVPSLTTVTKLNRLCQETRTSGRYATPRQEQVGGSEPFVSEMVDKVVYLTPR